MAKRKTIKTEEEVRSDLLDALKMVSEEKNVPVETLVSSIETALVSAYKKAFGGSGAVRVVANIETNDFRVYAQKRVVQTALNPNTEIAWREAREINPIINLGEEVEQEVTPSGFGRIAAQTAKQVLLQRVREAESRQIASEFAEHEQRMFRGTVQRMERGDIVIQLGKAEAFLPRREQIQGENYRFGDSIYIFVTDVRSGYRGPSIKVSRTHPGLVRELFTLEVPEIADGIVELKNVAREAGQRTKIAVAAENPDVDPVGACVGPRGMRVGKVVSELGNEKVDIVRWNEDPVTYISNALSPAQITRVTLVADADSPGGTLGTATVIVAEDQQSLAIGKQGQNVRLAARLTNWRIDIRTEKQIAEEQAKRMFLGEDDDALPITSGADTTKVDEFAGVFAIDDSHDDSSGDQEGASADTAEAAATEVVNEGAVNEGAAAPAGDVETPVDATSQVEPLSAPLDSPLPDERNEVSAVAPADSVRA